MNYVIEVQTGTLPGADTEANVFIQLIGAWSDSGKRALHRSNQDVPFEVGQVIISSLQFLKQPIVDYLKNVLLSLTHSVNRNLNAKYIHKKSKKVSHLIDMLQ